MVDVNVLLDGYKRFYAKHFVGDKRLYERLATKGQMPKTLMIACSDSRVDPSILLDAGAGDIFVIRNVANLVPPYQPSGESCHGTSAALEFAVNNLRVENIVVLGHSGCAGIAALFNEDKPSSGEFSFISGWVSIANDAKERAVKKCGDGSRDKFNLCGRESIISSINNLRTFPWIKKKVASSDMSLHGWYFSLDDGCLYTLSEDGSYVEVAV